MTPSRELHFGHAIRLVLVTVGTTLALAVIGYFPTQSLAGPRGSAGLALGLGIALAASLAGLWPPLRSLRRGPHERTNALLGGMALRFVLMLALLLAAIFSNWADRLTLAIWAVIGYLVLLVVDTAGLARLNRSAVRSPS